MEPMTIQEIIQAVGGKLLGEFDRRGWVRTGYRSLRLLNRAAMEAYLSENGA